jgi:hypothetical protein
MRFRILFSAILLSAAVVTGLAADDFSKWWPAFQASVAKTDAKSVVKGVHYPLQWENGKIRDIKSEAEFVRSFSTYFTPEIKRMIAQGKPEKFPGGYSITWKARGNEYSIYFKPDPSGGFALDGLSEGPP